MRFLTIFLVLAPILGGCAATNSISMSCSEYIGKPISERIAALGPPTAVVRVGPTQVGYKFVSTATTYSGGELYYTVNYLSRVDENRAPIYPTTGTCYGTFTVTAASDAVPLSRRIIVEVRPI